MRNMICFVCFCSLFVCSRLIGLCTIEPLAIGVSKKKTWNEAKLEPNPYLERHWNREAKPCQIHLEPEPTRKRNTVPETKPDRTTVPLTHLRKEVCSSESLDESIGAPDFGALFVQILLAFRLPAFRQQGLYGRTSQEDLPENGIALGPV